MGKIGVDWHTKPATDHQKDAILNRFRQYLRNAGLHDDTIKLYEGRARAFLDYVNCSDPDAILADKYMLSLSIAEFQDRISIIHVLLSRKCLR
jgi:hypothetical protein